MLKRFILLAVVALAAGAGPATKPAAPVNPPVKPPAAKAPEKKKARVVFAINAEGGAIQILEDAEDNILAAIRDMKRGQFFNIVASQDLKSVSFQKAPVPPTKDNLEAAGDFLKRVTSSAANEPSVAIVAAARQRPDVIWFIDIGNEEEKDLAAIKKAAAGIRVNTAARYASPPGDLKATHNLWQIARDTGGVCVGDDGKPIDEPKEAVQPREIPKGPSVFRE